MIALALALLGVQHEGHMMPGMAMPAPAARPTKRAAPPRRRPAARRPAAAVAAAAAPATPPAACTPEHAAMGHCAPAAAPPPPAAPDPCPPEHAAMGHCRPAAAAPAAPVAPAAAGTDLPAGDAPPPPAPAVDYAARSYDPAAMRTARERLYAEHGGQRFAQVVVNLAEAQFRGGRDGYRWDGEGWYGGDVDRLVVRSEGRGAFRGGVDDAEAQALWSRAVGPYFNLQAGARYDFEPGPARGYAALGFEGLAPYWFDVEGAVFVAGDGDVLARLEGYYDQRITQRLILQPRAELNLALQDDARRGTGSGLSDLELGLRLRYEFAREFAPYVGVSWDRRLGDTARFARAAGEGASDVSLVAGVRFWF